MRSKAVARTAGRGYHGQNLISSKAILPLSTHPGHRAKRAPSASVANDSKRTPSKPHDTTLFDLDHIRISDLARS